MTGNLPTCLPVYCSMAMEMHNRLACGLATVHADVVAARLMFQLDDSLRFDNHRSKRCPLFIREIKIGFDDTVRDHEKVTRRNWIPVPDDEEMFPPKKDSILLDLKEKTHGVIPLLLSRVMSRR